ncbi:C35C5.3 [Symbiodinium sp. CCMP2592]|nr:C35C5.3 [Symbiodinium sp. CCMP2592]
MGSSIGSCCFLEACHNCEPYFLDSMSSCRFSTQLENEEVLKPDAVGAGCKPAVLVLGGSTFMGRETVQTLLELPARVCVVNRGRSYWGTTDPSNGRVARLTADRRDRRGFSERLDMVTTRLQEKWTLVADFSAYDGADMRCALEGLRGRFDTYAYISSDSVYEVSSAAGSGWMLQAQAVDESCAQRPAEDTVRKKLRKADSYGDGKLEAEEALAEGLDSSTRAVALRLPDVIGPFDDTLRLWAYWHWLRAGADGCRPQVRKSPAKRARLEAQATTQSFDDPPLAFVFSRDVARFLAALVGRSLQKPFDAVNVGSDLQVPLRDFLELLSKAAAAAAKPGQGPAKGQADGSDGLLDEVDRPRSFLPSVERPLPLDFRHLKQAYGFDSTALPDVLKICADWFAGACKDFPEEAAEAAMKLPAAARTAALASAELLAPKSPASSSNSSATSSSS